jgi:hypothetical protein
MGGALSLKSRKSKYTTYKNKIQKGKRVKNEVNQK